MTKHRSPTQRRAQILQAATGCFARRGYYEATMDDIVQATGLSKGSLYWHFNSKRELFRALVEQWFADALQALSETLKLEAPAGQRLRAALAAVQASAEANRDLIRAMMEFYTMALRDEELKKWSREVYQANAGLLEDLIASGVAEGTFRTIDPGTMARLIMAYLDGILIHREMFDHQWPPFEEMADTLLQLLEPDHGGHGRV